MACRWDYTWGSTSGSVHTQIPSGQTEFNMLRFTWLPFLSQVPGLILGSHGVRILTSPREVGIIVLIPGLNLKEALLSTLALDVRQNP